MMISDTVRYLRKKKRLSARSLSEKAGVSPSYVNKLEAGAIDPSFIILGRILLVLGATPAEIVLLLREVTK